MIMYMGSFSGTHGNVVYHRPPLMEAGVGGPGVRTSKIEEHNSYQELFIERKNNVPSLSYGGSKVMIVS